jgi:hypothetical protein
MSGSDIGRHVELFPKWLRVDYGNLYNVSSPTNAQTGECRGSEGRPAC